MATTALTWRTPLPSTNGTYRAKPGSPGDTHRPQRGTNAMQTGRVGDSLGRSRPTPPCTLRTGRPAGDGCGGRRDRSACHRGPARSLGACVLSDRAAWPLGPRLEAAMVVHGGRACPQSLLPPLFKSRVHTL